MVIENRYNGGVYFLYCIFHINDIAAGHPAFGIVYDSSYGCLN